MFLKAFYQMIFHCCLAVFAFAEGTNPIRFLDFDISGDHVVMPRLCDLWLEMEDTTITIPK